MRTDQFLVHCPKESCKTQTFSWCTCGLHTPKKTPGEPVQKVVWTGSKWQTWCLNRFRLEVHPHVPVQNLKWTRPEPVHNPCELVQKASSSRSELVQAMNRFTFQKVHILNRFTPICSDRFTMGVNRFRTGSWAGSQSGKWTGLEVLLWTGPR